MVETKKNKKDKKGFMDKIKLEAYYQKQHDKMKKQKPTKYEERPTVNHNEKTPTDTLTEFKVKY